MGLILDDHVISFRIFYAEDEMLIGSIIISTS